MATTANILLKTAEFLRDLRYGTATGGSTTTLIDTGLDEPDDDLFNYGTIWFLSGNNSGKTAVVTDYNGTTKTLTFAAQSLACASGDRYAVLNANYRREALVAALNTALSALGPFDDVYTDATFIVVADQESYSIPTGYSSVKRVEFAQAAGAPYNWKINFHWRETAGKIYLDRTTVTGLTAGYAMRLHAEKAHASVWADADVVTDTIHPSSLALEAAYYAALTRSGFSENTDSATKSALERIVAMRQANPPRVYHMAKDPILPRW